jgi:hypothetical protein
MHEGVDAFSRRTKHPLKGWPVLFGAYEKPLVNGKSAFQQVGVSHKDQDVMQVDKSSAVYCEVSCAMHFEYT